MKNFRFPNHNAKPLLTLFFKNPPMETLVISLGGSVVAPSNVDVGFLKDFREFIFRNKDFRFIIIIGGGKVCREYQKAASEVMPQKKEDLDWIGVYSTRLNAQLVRSALSDLAHKVVIENPNKKIAFNERVLVASGWKPGWSTDFVAVTLARKYKVATVLNVTNKDFVYDKNPDEHDDAKPLHSISWSEFRKMFGSEWSPGLNVPFDPVASNAAHTAKIKVVVLGKDLKNIEQFLLNREFRGTVIQ